MSETIETVIVGAGVLGCAVARTLAEQGREVFVLEKNPGVTQGENQSSRNSGVIHAGLYYDQQSRPLKARLCPKGNRLMHQFCTDHAVPHLKCGKLVVAVREDELSVLELYLERSRQNQVPAEIISGERARELEPNSLALAALWLPTSGVVEATALVHKLYALASNAGAQFMTSTSLSQVEPAPDGLELTITYRDGVKDSFLAKRLINCAGLYADEVARLVNPASSYRVDPMRGEAACFQRSKRPELAHAGHNLYPTPHQVTLAGGTYWTVGTHLTPTLEPGPGGEPNLGSTVMVGPLNFAARNKEDYGGEPRPMAEFHGLVAGFFPGLRVDDLSLYQVGVQVRLCGHQDWVIEPDPAQPRCLNLLGVDSPGLTSSLAIAEYVQGLLD